MKNPPVVERLAVRYQDLDPYGHVNNAIHLSFFESVRIAYWRRLAAMRGVGDLRAGDFPGVRYVVAELNVRYRAPIFLDDVLHAAASIRTITNRSYTMDFQLRTGESFEEGTLTAEGSAAHVFYDTEAGEVRPRPEWFLSTVAKLEGRPEEDFAPEPRA
ncbi:MAG: acyl-CoA thioesterase [Actinomycetota bacterium]|nr:acyl-CoA thioesterase [Actinomycetota bacterium]